MAQTLDVLVPPLSREIPESDGKILWRVKPGYRRNANCGPHDGHSGYAAWFYTVAGERFNPAERNRSPEPAAAEHPSNRATREEMDYGTEAIA